MGGSGAGGSIEPLAGMTSQPEGGSGGSQATTTETGGTMGTTKPKPIVWRGMCQPPAFETEDTSSCAAGTWCVAGCSDDKKQFAFCSGSKAKSCLAAPCGQVKLVGVTNIPAPGMTLCGTGMLCSLSKGTKVFQWGKYTLEASGVCVPVCDPAVLGDRCSTTKLECSGPAGGLDEATSGVGSVGDLSLYCPSLWPNGPQGS